MGVSEYTAARVTVYSKGKAPLRLGLATQGFVGGSVPLTGNTTDLVGVSWARRMGGQKGAAGTLAFVLQGRRMGAVGHRWSDVIGPRDLVMLEVTCQRYPDPDGEMSHDWRVEFVGFVMKGGFRMDVETDQTQVTCMDSMGVLEQEHFSYWRNVGAVFSAGGNDAIVDILDSLDRIGKSEMDLMSNSIAASADILFRALFYNRLGFRYDVDGKKRRWEDLHAYRFESDDFGVNVDLQSLAPEGSSWMDAACWALDAPGFYEFWLDNIPADDLKRKLRNGGVADVGRSTQVKTKEAGVELNGDRVEAFVIRPLPFPTYDPERGGYYGGAWDALPTIECLPFGVISESTGRDAENIYSLFSVDTISSPDAKNSSADDASAEAQVVADVEAYWTRVGYRPLDARTKRFVMDGGQSQVISITELSRRLAWQLFSWNHYGDQFYSGVLEVPYDGRVRLGIRYVAHGMMYYVEGYQNSLDHQSATTAITVTRGLPAVVYGYRGSSRHARGPAWEEDDWQKRAGEYARHLGRKRPGEAYAPRAGTAMESAFAKQAGEHDEY